MTDLLSKYRSKNGSQNPPAPTSLPSGSPEPEFDAPSEPAAISEEMKDLLFGEGSVAIEELADYWGNFKKLASSPKAGSVLFVFKSHKVGFKEMQTYFSDVYLKRLGPAILDPDLDLHTYILYSLVLPHNTAIELSEMVNKASRDSGNASVWPLLSRMTGHDMQDRGDLVNLTRVILRRYPKVMDFFIPSNVVVKSK